MNGSFDFKEICYRDSTQEQHLNVIPNFSGANYSYNH
jgi:hypothetical protein